MYITVNILAIIYLLYYISIISMYICKHINIYSFRTNLLSVLQWIIYKQIYTPNLSQKMHCLEKLLSWPEVTYVGNTRMFSVVMTKDRTWKLLDGTNFDLRLVFPFPLLSDLYILFSCDDEFSPPSFSSNLLSYYIFN